MLYDCNVLKDYPTAAYYYKKASEFPDAPIYSGAISRNYVRPVSCQRPPVRVCRMEGVMGAAHAGREERMKMHEGDRIESEYPAP